MVERGRGASRPLALAKDDLVAVFSPSFPMAEEHPVRFRRGVSALQRALGVEVKVPAQRGTGYLAGSAAERASIFCELIADPRIKGIFCVGGGLNSAEMLDHLASNAPFESAKIVVGYSDCTSLLVGLGALGKWCTFYGPNVINQFADLPAPLTFTIENLKRAITSTHPFELLDSTTVAAEAPDWTRESDRTLNDAMGRQTWRAGQGEGVLFGGNLETLNFLVGTRYWRLPERLVFFWEVGERLPMRVARVHRALTHLKQCGVFDRTVAMLIGRSSYCTPFRNVDLRRMVLDVLGDYSFPIVAEMSFGHTDPMLTIPLGAPAHVVADGSRSVVRVLESAVVASA